MAAGSVDSSRASRTVLILGAGVAGLSAAAVLSDLGFSVHLVERSDRLGGKLAQLGRIFPGMGEGSALNLRLADAVADRETVKIHLSSVLEDIHGTAGAFRATIRPADKTGPGEQIAAGAVIVATGMEIIDASQIPELGYGRLKDVITSVELEGMLDPKGATGGKLLRPSDGKSVGRVIFIQCVGSRVERRGVPYCSNICCAASVKNALEIKDRCPGCEVHVLYIDMRMQGRGQEAMYKEARRRGVKFIRGQPSMVVRDRGRDQLVAQGENTLLKELYELPADLVVLGVGLGQPASNATLFKKLGISLNEEGLPIVAPGSEDGVTAAPGIYLAGCVEAPKDIKGAMLQGEAAAAKAASLLMRK
jgi:heterodisulfide reductase subunit A-like polyferredoxin